jgi:hypothetical protein
VIPLFQNDYEQRRYYKAALWWIAYVAKKILASTPMTQRSHNTLARVFSSTQTTLHARRMIAVRQSFLQPKHTRSVTPVHAEADQGCVCLVPHSPSRSDKIGALLQSVLRSSSGASL